MITDMGLTWYRAPIPHEHGKLWFPPNRCQDCGHRVAEWQYRAIETRKFPVWWWPFELVNRWQARLIKYLPPDVRGGTERTDL